MGRVKKNDTNSNTEISDLQNNAEVSNNGEISHLTYQFGKNSSAFSKKYSLWIFVLLVPYVLGFIIITVFCLSLVDISLDAYFKVLADNFSLLGLWTIGYFLISLLIIMYGSYYYAVKR